MKMELENILHRKYKHLGYTYSDVYDGWYELLSETLLKIDRELWNKYVPLFIKRLYFKLFKYKVSTFKILQIKTKYGGLRIYTNFITDNISKIINEAEDNANITCEFCGTTTTTDLHKINNWIYTVCDFCLPSIK